MEAAKWSLPLSMAFATVLAVSFVGALYLIPAAVRRRSRDDDIHIQYRLRVTIAMTAASLVVFHLAVPCTEALHVSSWTAVGLQLDRHTLPGALITLLLMVLFYLGPFVTYFVYALSSRDRLLDTLWKDAQWALSAQSNWACTRNLGVAPITEEIVFRGLIIGSLATAIAAEGGAQELHKSLWLLATLSPLWFGTAHVHHIVEKIRHGQAVTSAVLSSLFQLAYTSIFGCMAALLLMRTGSLYTAILSHMVCNFVGLPDLSFLSPPRGTQEASRRTLYTWRWVLLALHGLGLVLFSVALFPATEALCQQSFFCAGKGQDEN